MTFWNTDKLRQELESVAPPVIGADLTGLGDACYEMRLGSEAYVSSPSRELTHLDKVKTVTIPPGQFAILLTKEKLHLPKDILGFISLKASVKLGGLVNVSGFHVDPGFEGHIKFSVFNAGSKDITLRQDQRLFPIWFATLQGEDAGYDGAHKGQSTISGDDVMKLSGEVLSPAALCQQMKELKGHFEDWKLKMWLALGIAALTALAAVGQVLVSALNKAQ